MRGNPIVDNAIVDALSTVLEGARDVHLVGALSEAAQERLTRSHGGRLTTVDGPDPLRSRHETVVVLDAQRLGDAQAVVNPEGMLTVAAVNPRYGSLLLAVLEGRRAPGSESADLDGVCGRLERHGWEVRNATPVAVPPRRRAHAPPPPSEFSTLPWKTESEWREEARQGEARLAARPPGPEIGAIARVEAIARRAPEDTERMLEALRLRRLVQGDR